MRIIQYLIFALLPTLGWLMLTEQFNLISFVIGYILSFGVIATLLHGREIQMRPSRFPMQIWALFIYAVVLARDITLSGIDVLLRIFRIRPVRPGIIAVKIQDEDSVIAGLSAHGITITPGQLVVDFDEEGYLYVHCLDMENCVPNLDAEQTTRLKYLRKVRGKNG
jgi:multisubunit Na+/H+ antiporter MnhE subunit